MIDKRFYELVNHLWRGGKYAYYWTPDDGNGEKYTYWLAIDPLSAPHVPKQFYNHDAYFGVNPSVIRRSEHERARALDGDIVVINGFYFEIDFDDETGKQAALARIAASPIKPACLNFSGGGFHGYVLLRASYHLPIDDDKAHATLLQRAMVKHFGGDDGAKDLARVLRIPGTLNCKPEYAPNPPTVTIEQWDMGLLYDLTEIESHLQAAIDEIKAAEAARQAHPQRAPSSSTVSLSDQELWDVLFNSKNGAHYKALYDGDTGGDWSRADQQLCNGLAWVTGRDIARMDSMFRQSRLYRAKWDRDEYRNRTLNNAANSAQTVYTPGHVDQDAVNAAASAVGLGSQASANGTQTPPPPQGIFEALTYDQLIQLPPKKWLIERVVGENDIFMVYGEPGSGKSLVVIDLIFAACQGKKWAQQFNVTKPLNVAYCAGEGVSGLPDRFRSAADFWGISTLPNFFFFKMVPQLFARQRSDSITTFIQEWKAQTRPKLDLLIIDTQHTATAGADENSAKDMGEVLDAVRAAIRQLDCSVLVIHHTTKDGERERGSSSLHGAMDTMIKVKKNGENLIECTKLKDGEPWKPQKFTLISKGPSVYVFWDGAVQNQQTKDEIISLLIAHKNTSFSAKEVKDGLTASITTEAVRDALNYLVKQKAVQKIDAGQGKRDRWRYQILDSYVAIHNVAKS